MKELSKEEIDEKVKGEYIKYKIIEEQIENIISQREIIKQSIEEIKKSIKTIDKISELKNQNEIWFSIGSDIFLRGNISEKDRVFVNIGSGIIQEKNIENAKKFLNKKIEKMENTLEKINRSIEIQAKKMEDIEKRIQKLLNIKVDKEK
jgi:prefoldin alpha subunit